MQHHLSSLNGLKVVDLSRVLGGPYCTQILADHGADVLKIESPVGDETRTWGPPFDGNTAAYFLGVNRNKRGAVLDLSSESDRHILLRLLADADVLVENFKAGTLEKWGLGYEDTLQEQFPRLVHCRVSGFGIDGPLGSLPGYDAAVQAMTGLMAVNGEADSEPLRVGVPIVDMVTGLNAALGILMALRERETSGRGQMIESTLFDSALSLLHPHATNFLYSGKEPKRSGNAHPNITPYDKFRTNKGDVFLAVGNNGQFSKLCELANLSSLVTDERFTSNQKRTAHREALRTELERAFRCWDAIPLADALMRAGVPCAPVLSVEQALYQPHATHRKMHVSIESYRGIASPIKLSRTPATYRLRPPELNEPVTTTESNAATISWLPPVE